MKRIFLILVCGISILHGQDIDSPFNPKDPEIKIEEKNGLVHIYYEVGVTGGPQRITYSDVYASLETKKIYLIYFFIENSLPSQRHGENMIVPWVIRKENWDNWKKQYKIIIRKAADAHLNQEQVQIIKNEWKQ